MTQITQKEKIRMKQKLERIDNSTFTALDNFEELGVPGGFSTSHTIQQTLINGQPVEFLADIRID